jgi:hypothetical protein
MLESLEQLKTLQVPDGVTPLMAVMGWDDIIYVAVMLILSMVSYYISRKNQPEPVAPKPAALEDFSVPTAEIGREIPVLFGTRWIKSPNVVWYGDLMIEAKKEKVG